MNFVGLDEKVKFLAGLVQAGIGIMYLGMPYSND
jgi:tryptophan synthase alpha subunit